MTIDYPALFMAADAKSLAGQQAFLRATKARLLLLVLAAVMGVFRWHVGHSSGNWAAAVGAGAFVVAALLEIYLLVNKPDRTWYDGRAAAESTKTLAWRYAVGGQPFGLGELEPAEVDDLFLQRLGQVVAEVARAGLAAPADSSDQITDAMRALRASDLETRKARYREDRIEDQRAWYAAKATANDRRATGWALLLLVVEIGGAVGGILRATGAVDIDALGAAGAVVAAGAAWVQTKQHRSIARAYAIASHELASIASKFRWVNEETRWSEFVDQSEEAVSREHTLWRASHSNGS